MARRYDYNTNSYLRKIRKKKGLDSQQTFIREKRQISMGIQLLRKGDDYGEPAHRNSEIYFVLKGNARLKIGRRDFAVSPGMAMFVPPRVAHRFYGVKKEFVFLFIFSGLDE